MAKSSNEYMATYMNRRYRDRRSLAVEILGGCCKHCGVSDNGQLQFDHVDPEDKFVEISRLWSANMELFLYELEKCQLLCPDCHRKKSLVDRGQNDARVVHGTLSSYRYCRCDLCRAAKSEYSRVYNAKRRRS